MATDPARHVLTDDDLREAFALLMRARRWGRSGEKWTIAWRPDGPEGDRLHVELIKEDA